jgi:choline transport protein
MSSEALKPGQGLTDYSNEWISILGWWLASGSVANFVVSMILAIVTLWYPDFQSQHYQLYLIYVCVLWLAIAVNIFGASLVPKFNQFICKSFISTRKLFLMMVKSSWQS